MNDFRKAFNNRGQKLANPFPPSERIYSCNLCQTLRLGKQLIDGVCKEGCETRAENQAVSHCTNVGTSE